MSDCGDHGLTIIAFIGSVFSPYYAWARRRHGGVADPLDHCAINVALYRRDGAPTGANRWAMTERRRHAVSRSATHLQIGPSAMHWDQGDLCVDIDELTVPWPSRLRGRVRLMPLAMADRSHSLDAQGAHQWQPIAPISRIEVDMRQPALRWQGAAYLDSNRGDAPLEAHFDRWHWSRASLADGRCAVLYDVQARGTAPAVSLALAFDAQGNASSFAPPPMQALRGTGWGMARETRCDVGGTAIVKQTLENAPFYARSLLSTQLCGEPATAVHESLSLPRFAALPVQAMLPFRMPRAR